MLANVITCKMLNLHKEASTLGSFEFIICLCYAFGIMPQSYNINATTGKTYSTHIYTHDVDVIWGVFYTIFVKWNFGEVLGMVTRSLRWDYILQWIFKIIEIFLFMFLMKFITFYYYTEERIYIYDKYNTSFVGSQQIIQGKNWNYDFDAQAHSTLLLVLASIIIRLCYTIIYTTTAIEMKRCCKAPPVILLIFIKSEY